MKSIIIVFLLLMSSCALKNRKVEEPKYIIKVKTELDSSTYYCDYFHETDNTLTLYRTETLQGEPVMFLQVKSDKLEYKIKLKK